MKRLLSALIGFYAKWISPFLPSCCRYYPTCSAYAYQAISVYGWSKGSWLALKRILSCHPWSAGGYAPLPVKKEPEDKTTNCCQSQNTCLKHR